MTRKLVVIEKNERVRGAICRLLDAHGYSTMGASHGAEASQEMRGIDTPDLILIDQQVPIGGVRTARILRLCEAYRSIPIVIMAPSSKDEFLPVLQQGQQVGLRHFIGKPFDTSTLLKKVQACLESDPHGDLEPNGAPDIREEIRSLTQLPAMPDAHVRLLRLLRREDPEVDMPMVKRIVSSDPALTSSVLHVAKSAFFGFQGSFIDGAVTFLGVANLRKIVCASTVLNLFEAFKNLPGQEPAEGAKAFNLVELWRHQLACGVVMELLSTNVRMRSRSHFLVGILHDVGKVVLSHRFPEHFQEVVKIVQEEGKSMYRAEQELLGITHADIGGELASKWELPSEITTCIVHHHRPSQVSMHKRLAALVHVADIAVRRMGIGSGGDPLVPEMDPFASRLKIDVDTLISQKDAILKEVNGYAQGQDGA